MSEQTFTSHLKSDETVRIEILTNVCRMMVSRGNMDIRKYCYESYKDTDFNDIHYSLSTMIDDDKFVQYFAEKSDKNVYVIPMDSPIQDERSNKRDYDGTRLVISIIPHKINDIKNSDMINDIFKSYPDNHKLFIVDDIIEKASTALSEIKNVEVFLKDDLTIDLMSFVEAPHRCELDPNSTDLYSIKPNIPRIHQNDPLAQYYNAKVGDTLRITGNTVNNCFERRYRKVTEAKPMFS